VREASARSTLWLSLSGSSLPKDLTGQLIKQSERSLLTLAHIEETLIGVFALNMKGEILEKAIYSRNPEKIAIGIRKQRDGEVTAEVARAVDGLIKRGFDRISFTNQLLAEAVKAQYFVETEVVESSRAANSLKEDLPSIAVNQHLVKDEAAFFELSRVISTLLARGAVQDALGGKEALITQTVQLIGELDTALNGLASRVREWYGLHYPELSRIIRDHPSYCRFVAMIGARGNAIDERLNTLELQAREVSSILKSVSGSMGADLPETDLKEIQRLAQQTLNLYEYRKHITEYVGGIAQDVAPNVSALCGPLLAAKLIEKAGGLRKMAMSPSSSIQILGAEKALYRAVKTNARPPKHGLIFQHPYVNGAPRGLRGIRARHFAAKLAIAARADAFSGNFIADELKKQLDDAKTG
jgi:nucleolar protein 56